MATGQRPTGSGSPVFRQSDAPVRLEAALGRTGTPRAGQAGRWGLVGGPCDPHARFHIKVDCFSTNKFCIKFL